MKCLIIAAGQGTRLKAKGEVKPLVPLLGVPLIERIIRSAVEGGADEFYVVTGYQGDKVANFLKQLSNRLNVVVTLIQNDDWQKENGFSVLKARDVMEEPFLLLMADHLFDPAVIRSLQEQTLNEGEILLAVDTDKNNPLIDMEDVTKVRIKDGYILNIGKTIDDFNGFDTGLFLCQVEIIETYEHKHQVLNKNKPTEGLIRTATDTGKALFRVLSQDGLVMSEAFFRTLMTAYIQESRIAIEKYHALALLNGLAYDRHEEIEAVDAFVGSLCLAVEEFVRDPIGSPMLAPWVRIAAAIPDFSERLNAAVEQDNR